MYDLTFHRLLYTLCELIALTRLQKCALADLSDPSLITSPKLVHIKFKQAPDGKKYKLAWDQDIEIADKI